VTVNLPTTSVKCHCTTLWNAELVHLIEGILFSSKCWWLWKEPVVLCDIGALKKTDSGMWQLECQACNVTASIQNDDLLHGHMLPILFTTDQSLHPPCSAEIRPMSQQAAATTRPYRELVLDTHTPASWLSNLLDLNQDYWLAMSGLMNWGILHRRSSTVSLARCVGALSCWKTNMSPVHAIPYLKSNEQVLLHFIR